MYTISLKAARINAEMSQAEAAKAIGVSSSALASWEQGKHTIKYDNVKMLADVYKIPVDIIRMPVCSQK